MGMDAEAWNLVLGLAFELEGLAPVVTTTETSRRSAEGPSKKLSFPDEEATDEADVYGSYDPTDAKSFVLQLSPPSACQRVDERSIDAFLF